MNEDRKTEQGFTPGPWSLTNDGTYIRPDCLKGRMLRAEPATDQHCWPAICHVDPWPQDRWDCLGPEESLANARLIAAAPALYDAVSTLLSAMEMQEGREKEELHILQSEAWHIWTNAKFHARAALALVNTAADESAKRPLSTDQQHGQASLTE